ncbi:MAG: hypothetical protein EPN98_12125 [Phenylobacterium sp.]|uniref:hypothetical protein n=1 Tax=Phenylobacterium sp. TaxID=1871053 RepID=UPI0012209A11|nr:hypothetical protein [Phenylobacterium sp.]TAL33105.1 MAG: hypothetical protein EPN98_12125 [Phenylobacterium sp.]
MSPHGSAGDFQMLRMFTIGAAATLYAGAAWAQASTSLPLDKDLSTRAQSADKSNADAPSASLKLFLSSEYVASGDVDAIGGSDLQENSSSVTTGLEGEAEVNSILKVSASGSAGLTEDYLAADKDGANFSGSVKLGVSGKPIAPFLKYGVARKYMGVFDDYDRTEQTFTVGSIFDIPIWRRCPTADDCTRVLGVKITPSIGYTKSDKNAKERSTPGVTVAFDGLDTLGIKWTLEGLHEWQKFEEPGVGMTRRRRDERSQVYLGTDLVGLLDKLPGEQNLKFLSAIKVGVRWVRHESNSPDPTESYERWQFLPTIRLEHPIGAN